MSALEKNPSMTIMNRWLPKRNALYKKTLHFDYCIAYPMLFKSFQVDDD